MKRVAVRGHSRTLTLAESKRSLRAAYATEVEAQHREALAHEGMKQGVDHLVVHGAAVLRMGMQHERDGRVGALAVLVASFKSAFRPVEDHVRHRLFFLSFGNQPAQGRSEEHTSELQSLMRISSAV